MDFISETTKNRIPFTKITQDIYLFCVCLGYSVETKYLCFVRNDEIKTTLNYQQWTWKKNPHIYIITEILYYLSFYAERSCLQFLRSFITWKSIMALSVVWECWQVWLKPIMDIMTWMMHCRHEWLHVDSWKIYCSASIFQNEVIWQEILSSTKASLYSYLKWSHGMGALC